MAQNSSCAYPSDCPDHIQDSAIIHSASMMVSACLILQSVPAGQKVGIAFSGGLDTSAALHWMRARARSPTPTPQPRAAGRDELRHYPPAGARVRCREARLIGAALSWSLRARRAAKRRLPSTAGVFTSTTPIGRAVTGTMLVVAMKDDGSTSGETEARSKTTSALLSLRPAGVQSQIYKPWLDQQFIGELGGRKRCRSTWCERDSRTV
jgi:argininosuccinate synthase